MINNVKKLPAIDINVINKKYSASKYFSTVKKTYTDAILIKFTTIFTLSSMKFLTLIAKTKEANLCNII